MKADDKLYFLDGVHPQHNSMSSLRVAGKREDQRNQKQFRQARIKSERSPEPEGLRS